MTATIQDLKEISSKLNEESDKFNEQILRIDSVLQHMGVGLVVWVKIPESNLELGYNKFKSSWSLAVRETQNDKEQYIWPLTHAPRSFRISAIVMIDDLIQDLHRKAEKTIKKLSEVTEDLKHLATAMENDNRQS